MYLSTGIKIECNHDADGWVYIIICTRTTRNFREKTIIFRNLLKRKIQQQQQRQHI